MINIYYDVTTIIVLKIIYGIICQDIIVSVEIYVKGG